jgi:beta-glucanase (GH16 family)
MQYLSLLLGASALLTPVFAQTWTSCNPMNTTCPNDPALGINHTFVFNTSTTVTNSFNITAGTIGYDATKGASFTVAKKGDSPTIQSQFYIFFGSVSVIMQAATGQGIISSIVLESDDLDEVDWEFMGGNGTSAETNYFGKGNTTLFDRAIYYPVSSAPRENFHNYTTDWTAERIEWYIDSVLVRTLEYADADGGYNYPQTPMTVRMGIWAGGDSGNSPGTIQWAGGLTDYSQGPYTMYVQSAQVNDYSTGSAYEYTDKSGSWQSIKTIS